MSSFSLRLPPYVSSPSEYGAPSIFDLIRPKFGACLVVLLGRFVELEGSSR